MKYTTNLQAAFNNAVDRLMDDCLWDCALINESNEASFFKNEWEMVEYLKYSIGEFIFIPYPYNPYKVRNVKGNVKKNFSQVLNLTKTLT